MCKVLGSLELAMVGGVDERRGRDGKRQMKCDVERDKARKEWGRMERKGRGGERRKLSKVFTVFYIDISRRLSRRHQVSRRRK
jgi:hypothetical protein